MKKLLKLLLLCSLAYLYMGLTFGPEPANPDECLAYIPGSISPNGDGINDLFFLEPSCEWQDYSLVIYNSDKEVVFQSKNDQQVWDGSVNGFPLPQGYYKWVLNFVKKETGDRIQKTGEVALIR
jgi:gliding motility-associated-like protein